MKGVYIMNGYTELLINEAIKEKKFNVITECSRIVNPDKCDIIVEQYSGSSIRVFKNNDTISVLYPENPDEVVQESEYLANAIASGEIFDDAERIEDASTYVIRTGLPIDSIEKQGITSTQAGLMPVVSATIGTVNNDCIDCGETELKNGYSIMKDVVTSGSSGSGTRDIIRNYMDIKEKDDLPMAINRNMFPFDQALDELNNYDDDEALPDDDIIDSIVGDDEPDPAESEYPVEEAFFSKKPKKLKPIPARDIVSYITIEINSIRDSNDQAMLAGYTCSKLEVADFYLSCIDSDDSRYIVPHTRQFIVQYQNDLNRLLQQILKLKPINRNDRVWKVDVTYPKGYQG